MVPTVSPTSAYRFPTISPNRLDCPAGTLYTIWGGGNDLVDAANGADDDLLTRASVPVNAFESVATSAVTNIESYVNQLIAAGAEYIIWPNLPELEQIPHTRETRDIKNPLDSAF